MEQPKKRRGIFGTKTPFKQYPQQVNGKRELRAMENRPQSDERPRTSRTSSADAPIPTVLVHHSSNVALNEPLVEDFQDRYTTRPAFSKSETNVSTHRRNISLPAADAVSISEPDFSGMSDSDNDKAPPPPEFTQRGMHIPTRTRYDYTSSREDLYDARSRSQPTSSAAHNAQRSAPPQQRPRSVHKREQSGPQSDPNTSTPTTPETARADDIYGAGNRSSADSVFSQETSATSIHTLPALQTKGADNSDAQQLEPLIEDDPKSWDLVAPADEPSGQGGYYALEKRAEMLFSYDHLRLIFDDPKLLLKFTGFLNSHRPKSIPILIYYLDALKALRAISYANAIAEALDPIPGFRFTDQNPQTTANQALEEKANKAFEVLVREDLPAYIAHVWVQVVSVSIQRRITGTLAPHLREASEGLAEVFCLTDPSRTDNPIVFASEEFARTTQYGMGYTIGRNCRFLQGPRTSPHSVRRLAEACQAGKELTEVFVNYRRDGSPFMNLLMIAPLMDSRGNIRYYIGAQVDVSGLIKDCSELDGLARLAAREQDPEAAADEEDANRKDEFQELSEMFNGAELQTVTKYGGRMHKEYADESDRDSVHSRRRLVLQDPSQEILDKQRDSMSSSVPSTVREKLNGKLEGVYQHYLLIRPAPSLRILFTSPTLRVPGILQSPFLNRIGGSSRVRSDLQAALAEGRGVTAKIRWLTKADEDGDGEGRPRWIHCTPLLGHSGAVGVWMIVLVDEEGSREQANQNRRFRPAPPVSSNIAGKDWDATQRKPHRQLNVYDADTQRRGGAAGARENAPPATRPPTGRVNSQAPSYIDRGRPVSDGGARASRNPSEFSVGLRQ